MKDLITVDRVALLHPKFIPMITAFIDRIEARTGLTFRVVQGLRTFAEQDAIYQQGRTKPGPIVTYSPAGTSYHNYGISVDLVPFFPPVNPMNQTGLNWKYTFGAIKADALALGLQCGMDFPHPDYDHFENKFGYNWRDLLHKHTVKDFIPGTTFVNI